MKKKDHKRDARDEKWEEERRATRRLVHSIYEHLSRFRLDAEDAGLWPGAGLSLKAEVGPGVHEVLMDVWQLAVSCNACFVRHEAWGGERQLHVKLGREPWWSDTELHRFLTMSVSAHSWEGNRMRRLPVIRHRTANHVRAAYRACRDGFEKTRWHAIWLLLRTDVPRTPAQVAEVVGVSVQSVRAALRRWNEHGPEGLTDRRAANRGRPRLSDEQRAELFAALQKRPPDGGLWSGPKVARYAADRWGVVVRPETGWRWLRGLGFTLQVPRPRHPHAADPPTQKRWKKTWADG